MSVQCETQTRCAVANSEAWLTLASGGRAKDGRPVAPFNILVSSFLIFSVQARHRNLHHTHMLKVYLFRTAHIELKSILVVVIDANKHHP
jgi:hypothetical protein